MISRGLSSILPALIFLSGPSPLAAQTLTRATLTGMPLTPSIVVNPNNSPPIAQPLTASLLSSMPAAVLAPVAAIAPEATPKAGPSSIRKHAPLAATASPDAGVPRKAAELDAMFENSRFMATQIVVGPKTFELATKRTPRSTIKTALPKILKKQFKATLSHYPHSSAKSGELTTYTVPRGLEFWAEFVDSKDFDTRVAASAFLDSRKKPDGAAERIVKGMISPLRHESHVIDASKLTPSEMTAVKTLAETRKLNVGRWDRYMQIGGGAAFFILNHIFSAASKLTDPVLIARFSRVARFLAATGIAIITESNQGAVASYTPMTDEMAYVMPSRSELGPTAHELNHARFQRFTDRLESWRKSKGYALPFEIDGPPPISPVLGSFGTLFDELNSWRIGSSFDDKSSDASILGTLHQSYGSEVGWENVRLFGEAWTAAKVAGKSAPRIMLAATRALNAVKDEDLDAFARDALERGDVIKAHNFLRLIAARYPNIGELSAERKALIRKFTLHPDKDVVDQARHLLKMRKMPTVAGEAWGLDFSVGDIFSDKTPRAVQEKALAKVLRLALTADGKKHVGRHDLAIDVLQDIFDQWGWQPIYEQGKNNRPAQPGHVFFSPTIDDLLARGMFDGTSGEFRVDLINMISAYTHPQELPRLHRRVIKALTAKNSNIYNSYQALDFLTSEDDAAPSHIAWGQSVVEAVQNDKTPSAEALEYAGEFYRTRLSYSLPGDNWGRSPKIRLDRDTRSATEKGLRTMTSLQRGRFEKAIRHLKLLLSHEDEAVRLSARYAIATYPGYMIELEDLILQGLKAPASGLRMNLVNLVAMTDKGFLPRVDEWIAGPFTPTTEEAEMLVLRR